MRKNNFAFALSLVFAIGCSGDKYTQQLNSLKKIEEVKHDYVGMKANLCTLNPKLLEDQAKLIFSLDISGSNGWTDPQREKRYGNLINWLNSRAPGSQNEFYTLQEWSGDNASGAPGLIGVDPKYAPFTNDISLFTSVVETQKNSSVDNGGTPYELALRLIADTIRADAMKAKERAENGEPAQASVYPVIFLSDGQPTGSHNTKEAIVALIETEIMSLLNHIELGPFIKQITINTGYYHEDGGFNQNANDILEEMAKVGKGSFYYFGAGATISYDDLTNYQTKKITTAYSELIINNLNTIWDMSAGKLLLDSDADFLPDVEELKLGSDPFRADSDDNGIRDGIEALLDINGRPCKGALCEPSKAIPYNGCFVDASAQPKILVDSDGDGLGECEEELLGTDAKSVDTDKDGLPDFLAAKFSLPATKREDAISAGSIDSDFDGVSNLVEVKQNTPPRMDNRVFTNLKPQKYQLRQTSYNSRTGVACYSLDVTEITFMTQQDDFRVWLKEIETNQTGRTFWRILDKKATGDAVELVKEDFANAIPRQ